MCRTRSSQAAFSERLENISMDPELKLKGQKPLRGIELHDQRNAKVQRKHSFQATLNLCANFKQKELAIPSELVNGRSLLLSMQYPFNR